MTTTLPLYWGLSSSNKGERLDASVKLVGALEEFHAQYLTKSSPDESEVEEDNEDTLEERPLLEQFDSSNAQDVSYAIRRLIRGLGSPRESSRLGFAVALTELLVHIDTVSCAQIIALIHSSSESSGSMTGQEERDVLFARLFGFSVIIQSGLLVRKTPMPTSSAIPSSLPCFQTIVTDLLALGEKKSWLKESSWCTLISAVESVHSSEVKWRDDAIRFVEQRLFVEDKSWSPEKVALALKLTTLYPSKKWKGLFSPPFKQPDILSSSNLVALARILKESNVDDSSEPQQSRPNTGSWKPQLHFVWDTIFDNLLYTGQTKRTSGNFQDFFRIVVDDSLFASSSSSERKYWGFLVFLKALHRLPSSDLPLLFTKNFMRCWINHLSNDDRYLHKVAKKVASEIHAMVTKDPTAGFTLVLQLTGAHGTRQFDRVTKTRTVESILSSMDVSGIKQYIDFLLSQVNGEDDLHSGPPLEARREWVVDQLALLLRNGSILKDNQWVSDALGWLTVHAFFDVVKKSAKSPHRALQVVPKPTFSEGLRTLCRERLFSCLAELTRPVPLGKHTDSGTVRAVGAPSDDEFWVVKTIHMVSNLVQDGKHVRPVFSVDGEALNAFKILTKTLHTLSSDSVSECSREPARGAQLLLAGMQLRNFFSSDDDAAETDFDELQSCCRAATTTFISDKQSNHVGDSVPSESEDAATPIDTLVDGIIGLLETSTTLTREVANQSFAMLTGLVQQSTIDLVLTQLERRDPEATADESEDENEETEAVTNDLAEQVKSSEEAVSESEGETDSNHSAVDSDDEDGNESDTAKLRMHLENVFAANGDPPNQRLSQDDSSDEESMDDDQMMAIDEQLASIFRTKKNEKKSTKDAGAQRAATHFKNRVLDLVDIFIRKQPSNPLTVRVILPMVEVIMAAGADERQLSDKATGIVRSRFSKPKEFPPNIDNRVATDALEILHSKARRAHSSDMVTTLSQCSVYMAKCILPLGEASLLRVYKESFVDFATRKGSSLHPSFFLDFIRRFPSQGWALRRELLELAPKSVNGYRQSQMFHFIQVILAQSSNTQPEEFTNYVLSLRKALHSAILEASTNPNTTLNMTQAKEVLKTGLQIARQTKRIATPQDITRIWEPDTWDDLSQSLATSKQFKASKSLQDLCRQISRIAREGQKPGETMTKEPKRKSEENNHDGASEEKHRRKKVKRQGHNK